MVSHGRAGRWLGLLAVCMLALGARVATAQSIKTIVGPGNQDGLLATQATLDGPFFITADASGIYVMELGLLGPGGILGQSSNGDLLFYPKVQKITLDGRIVRVAGTGAPGTGGDGGKATEAQINFPYQIAADGKGNLYIADRRGNNVRKVDAQGMMSTVAGTGTAGNSGDGGKATEAQLSAPRGVAADANGNVYIADTGNNIVRRVDSNGIITKVAGSGNVAFDGDGGKAVDASLASPRSLAVDGQGNLYIADYTNARIRRVDKDGNINTVAGNGEKGVGGDGGKATAAQLEAPLDVKVDAAGNIYVAQGLANRIRRVSAADNTITTVAGTGTPGFNGETGKASELQLNTPFSIAIDANQNLVIADSANARVRRLAPDGMVATIAGGVGANNLPADQVSVLVPRGGVRDAAGNTYIADNGHYRILKVDPSGSVTVVAGNGATGEYRDGAKATEVSLGIPTDSYHVDGLALDSAGNLYIPALSLARVLKVDPNGIITTVAGNGTPGFAGDGGKATEAQISDGFWNVAVDQQGNLYIADGNNHRVRRVDKNGIITTFAGNGDENYSGDGGKATEAGIPGPDGVTVGPDGSVYITDTTDVRVRKVLPDGTITTIAGTGEEGYSGDGGKAIEAQISTTTENAAVDAAGNVYLADATNNVIRRVKPDGIIESFAGSGKEGFNGDSGALKEVNVSEIRDLYIDLAARILTWAENSPFSSRVRMLVLPQ